MTVLGHLKTSTYLNISSREYATYVMEQRAIPIITDGLKLSQRIALHLLRHQEKPVKTAGIVGDMMKSGLYVHGDASAADAIGRLAAPFLNNHCLIQGEGQFGTRVAPVDGIGAPRYTEVRRSKFAEQELYIDLDICPQRENYDGSKFMPQTFLPRLPLILLNGVNGIAIGFANKILPRSLDELRGAVVDVLRDGETKRPLMPFYDRYNCEVLADHSTPNKYYLRGRLTIENTTTVRITELPPGMALTTITERLIALEEEKTIVSFADNSTDHIDIIIKMTRAELGDKTENQLITLFRLVVAETENLTVLDPTGKRVIKYSNVQDMVRDFVNWRLGLYEARYADLLQKEQTSALFWLTFLACFKDQGDDVRPKTVASSISTIKSRADMMAMVRSAAKFHGVKPTDDIVDRIVGLPVYKFTKDGLAEGQEKYKATMVAINEFESILASPAKRKKIYQKEVAG